MSQINILNINDDNQSISYKRASINNEKISVLPNHYECTMEETEEIMGKVKNLFSKLDCAPRPIKFLKNIVNGYNANIFPVFHDIEITLNGIDGILTCQMDYLVDAYFYDVGHRQITPPNGWASNSELIGMHVNKSSLRMYYITFYDPIAMKDSQISLDDLYFFKKYFKEPNAAQTN